MIIPASHRMEPIVLGTTWDPATLEIKEDGNVKDLTGCTISLVIHKPGDPSVIIDTLLDEDGLVIDRPKGLIAPLRTFGDVNSTYSTGLFSWYLNIAEPTGIEINRYAEGTVEVRE